MNQMKEREGEVILNVCVFFFLLSSLSNEDNDEKKMDAFFLSMNNENACTQSMNRVATTYFNIVDSRLPSFSLRFSTHI
jgi:hypothetical protein